MPVASHESVSIYIIVLSYCCRRLLNTAEFLYGVPSDLGLYVWFGLALSYIWDRVCSIFSGAGKCFLTHGLRHFTRDVKSDSRILNFRSDVTYASPRKTSNDVLRRSLCDVIGQNKRNYE